MISKKTKNTFGDHFESQKSTFVVFAQKRLILKVMSDAWQQIRIVWPCAQNWRSDIWSWILDLISIFKFLWSEKQTKKLKNTKKLNTKSQRFRFFRSCLFQRNFWHMWTNYNSLIIHSELTLWLLVPNLRPSKISFLWPNPKIKKKRYWKTLQRIFRDHSAKFLLCRKNFAGLQSFWIGEKKVWAHHHDHRHTEDLVEASRVLWGVTNRL